MYVTYIIIHSIFKLMNKCYGTNTKSLVIGVGNDEIKWE